MYISRVMIENIRCFGSGEHAVNLDLCRPDGSYAGWTVIAGRNGAGKTTLLRAIAMTVAGVRVASVLQPTFGGWLRRGAKEGYVELFLVPHAQDGERQWHEGEWPMMKFVWQLDSFGPKEDRAGILHAYENTDEDRISPSQRLWAQQPIGWFIAGYGPFRRLTGEAADAQRLRKTSSPISRLVSLFREDVALGDSVEWLKELNHRKLERDAEAEELENRILALLNDGLLPDKTLVRRVDSRGLWLEQSGIELTVHDLSDGYRTVIALILDIARQMHECYGELPWVAGQARLAVDLPGVVLIDEIDAHLHVSWQQDIGFWLKERFPRVQFLVTTHSPFICQAADPRGLIRLPAPGEERAAEHVPDELYYRVVNGSADDAVLSDLFGLEHSRSPVAEAKLEEAAALEAKILVGSATPQDEQRHEELARELPAGPGAEMERAIRSLDKTLESRVPDEQAEP
jgi:energy-coupling factor transporter ATP-binding protein EcfA2